MIMTTDAVVFMAVNKNKCDFNKLLFLLSVSNLISFLLLPFSLFFFFSYIVLFPQQVMWSHCIGDVFVYVTV